MKKLHRGDGQRHARVHIPVGKQKGAPLGGRWPLSGFLLAIATISFAVGASRAEAAEPTRHLAFMASNTLVVDAQGHAVVDRDGLLQFVNRTDLVVSNPTSAEVDFAAPDPFGVPVRVPAHTSITFRTWPSAGYSGLAFADLPAQLVAKVVTNDAHGNPLVGQPLVSSTVGLEFPSLLWGADNRPYVVVAGDVEDVQFFDGDGFLVSAESIKAPLGPGSARILPVPLGAVRAVVRPLVPLICPSGGCAPSVVYAEAFDARQSGRYEFNNPESAVEVSP